MPLFPLGDFVHVRIILRCSAATGPYYNSFYYPILTKETQQRNTRVRESGYKMSPKNKKRKSAPAPPGSVLQPAPHMGTLGNAFGESQLRRTLLGLYGRLDE